MKKMKEKIKQGKLSPDKALDFIKKSEAKGRSTSTDFVDWVRRNGWARYNAARKEEK